MVKVASFESTWISILKLVFEIIWFEIVTSGYNAATVADSLMKFLVKMFT